MSRNQRKWVGKITTQPLDPDLVLSRHMKWARDPTQRFSTLDGPEPDNLTCASAWLGRIPDNAMAKEAFIYKDKHTNLWIQAVPWSTVPDTGVTKWNDMQRALGAIAVWYNGNAKPMRRRKTFAERELSNMASKEVTYVDLLHEAQRLQFKDIDMVKLVPLAEPRSVDIDILKLMSKENLSGRRRYPKLAPGQKQQQATKPVRTPLGVFKSVTEAARHHNMTISKMSIIVRTDSYEDYQFITRDEYLKLTTAVNTSE